MIDLSLRQKELLRQLFSDEHLSSLVSIIKGSSEGEWTDLSNVLLKKEQNISATVFIDGASELENSNAGVGGIFFSDKAFNSELYSFSENIGAATNNEAEYQALLKSLDISKELNIHRLDIFSDSELLVKQVNLEYMVKNERLKKLHSEARSKLLDFKWVLTHIRREKNKKADFLSKEALGKNSIK